MTIPIRVLVVGAPAATRDLREALESSGLRVVGEVASAGDIAGDESIDVVVLADDRLLDEMTGWRERTPPALVVLTRDDRVAPDLAGRGLRGWAIVPADGSAADLAVASAAAASGFAVRPASSERDEADADEADDGELSAPIEALTAREREVLELVSEGLPNKAIASRLGVSDHTVKFHLSSIFSKLGVSTRTEAVRRAVRAGLINF